MAGRWRSTGMHLSEVEAHNSLEGVHVGARCKQCRPSEVAAAAGAGSSSCGATVEGDGDTLGSADDESPSTDGWAPPPATVDYSDWT